MKRRKGKKKYLSQALLNWSIWRWSEETKQTLQVIFKYKIVNPCCRGIKKLNERLGGRVKEL